MEKITVNKTQLLETIKKNREAHRGAFLDALEGYRKQAIQALEESLTEARSGRKIGRKFTVLAEPADMTRHYDTTIRMLQDDINDEVEITRQDYRNYVLDDWEWTKNWIASNSSYGERGGNFHKYSAAKGMEVY